MSSPGLRIKIPGLFVAIEMGQYQLLKCRLFFISRYRRFDDNDIFLTAMYVLCMYVCMYVNACHNNFL